MFGGGRRRGARETTWRRIWTGDCSLDNENWVIGEWWMLSMPRASIGNQEQRVSKVNVSKTSKTKELLDGWLQLLVKGSLCKEYLAYRRKFESPFNYRNVSKTSVQQFMQIGESHTVPVVLAAWLAAWPNREVRWPCVAVVIIFRNRCTDNKI